MSNNPTFPTSGNLYTFPALNAGVLYVNGVRFEDYINQLVFEDQFEQTEITELKLLVQYLNTSGLSSEWIVDNNNKNQDLKTLITALETKLANINTSALTETSVLTNDNRNSVLKTRLDTAAADLTALTTRVTTAEGDIDNLETRMTTAEGDIDNLETRMTTAEGDIDGVETKTRFITEASVTGTGNNTTSIYTTLVGPPSGEDGISIIELKQKNAPSGDLIGYKITSNFDDDDYDYNESIYSHPHGRTTMKASTIRIQATEQIRIGGFNEYGDSLGGAVNIGGRGGYVNIGSIDALSTGTTSTQIQIGKQSDTAPNTSTRISGNVYLSDARFEDLTKSSAFTISSLLALMASGAPAYVIGFFSGASALPYSDVWCMKGGFAGNKKGDVETRNSIMVSELYVVNKDIVAIAPKVGFFLAKADYSCTQLIGDHRTQVFEGEITLRNNNITSTNVDWMFSNANDKVNVVNIGGDSGILIHQGASDDGAPLRIINSCSGNIEFELGDGGTQASATVSANGGHGMSIRSIPLINSNGDAYAGGMVRMGIYSRGNPTSNPFWGTYQLEINQFIGREGMIIAKMFQGDNYDISYKTNIINGDSINTQGTITGIDVVGTTSISAPTATATSLVINANYTGDTTNRLYKNADGKLFWNGVELGSNLGGGGGGLEYYIQLDNNVTNPAPNPTAQIATETYTNAPQRTITQSTTAVATGLRMARHVTAVINKESNPFVEGLQTIQQYLTWSENNTVGQLYGECWFQAEATDGAIVYARTYTPGVTTNGLNVLSSKPILAPNGLFNLSVKSVEFPGINVDTFNGATMTIKCRLEARDLITANWTILQTSTNTITYTLDNQINQTLTFTEDFVHNQTTKVNAPNAYRFVLFTTSPNGNGHLIQTNSGTVAGDEIAYRLGSGSTTASIRVLLYDGVNAKQTIAHTTTPLLVPIELPISPPYEIGPFNNGRLAFDIFMYQPSGAVNANHQMRFFFGEGTISHIESTINEPPAPTPTLAQILNSGATASQDINMNSHKISGITTLEGAANGNWNVKDLTEGDRITITNNNGNYTITADNQVSDYSVKDLTEGDRITITNDNNGNYTIAADNQVSDYLIKNITAGTGIDVQINATTKTATITSLNLTSQATQDEDQALVEVGALPRKPVYWGTNWVIADDVARLHHDMFVSVDGQVIVSAAGYYPNRYSRDYGITWGAGDQDRFWTSVCGTSQGSKIFGFAIFIAQNQAESLVFYTSANQGQNWTQRASAAFSGLNKVNRVRCSGNGQYLVASVNNSATGGRFLYSITGRDDVPTWTSRLLNASLPSGRTEGVCMSRSGATQFITWINDANNNSGIFRSLDYGATWAQIFSHIQGGNWTRIECDATGRFVWATRFVNITTPYILTWYSDDYGSNWYQSSMNGMEDIWVSATGQFVAGVSNPQDQGISYFVYSSDYGRTFTGVGNPASAVNNTYRTLNGSGDGSVLVIGSSNQTESGYVGDGKIRIAREGRQNIQDLSIVGGSVTTNGGVYTLTNDVVLWYSTNIKSSSAVNNAVFPINATYGNINFDTHNIEYEIEINWDRQTSVSPSAHIRMGFNGIDSEINTHSANTTWVLRLEQASASIHAGNQGAIGYDQHFNNRFYCGYSALQGSGDFYRYRTILTGQMGVQKRRQAQTVDLGDNYSGADWSFDARTLTNRFTSDSYVITSTLFSPTGPDRSILGSQSNFDDGHHCVSGTAIWELTDAGAWELGYGGASTALKDGIKNINISFVNNPNAAGINRSFDISARFWRVRK